LQISRTSVGPISALPLRDIPAKRWRCILRARSTRADRLGRLSQPHVGQFIIGHAWHFGVGVNAVGEWYYSNWGKQNHHSLTCFPVAPCQTVW
jgi:hypothetical protein